MTALAQWLAPLDHLPLECDGLTRITSMLMQRDGIDHRVCVGSLHIPELGTIPLHWWIALAAGGVCDFRARMWLGLSSKVPHGLFVPLEHQQYVLSAAMEPEQAALPPGCVFGPCGAAYGRLSSAQAASTFGEQP